MSGDEMNVVSERNETKPARQTEKKKREAVTVGVSL